MYRVGVEVDGGTPPTPLTHLPPMLASCVTIVSTTPNQQIGIGIVQSIEHAHILPVTHALI